MHRSALTDRFREDKKLCLLRLNLRRAYGKFICTWKISTTKNKVLYDCSNNFHEIYRTPHSTSASTLNELKHFPKTPHRNEKSHPTWRNRSLNRKQDGDKHLPSEKKKKRTNFSQPLHQLAEGVERVINNISIHIHRSLPDRGCDEPAERMSFISSQQW